MIATTPQEPVFGFRGRRLRGDRQSGIASRGSGNLALLGACRDVHVFSIVFDYVEADVDVMSSKEVDGEKTG